MFCGSWKSYKTKLGEVTDYFRDLPMYSADFNPAYEVVICPSFVHMETAARVIPSNIKLGAQDCSQFGGGAHTGETSASQLAGFGVKYCILGHVERRKEGETDTQINNKIKMCLANGISPIVCFGETLVEYDNNQTRLVLERQMRDSLLGIRDLEHVVLCYMPIWSIGTGFYTPGEYSNIIADFMRKQAVKLTGNPMAANCTILFGGQITAGNVQEYLECPEVDGVMFAIAALNPADFAQIVKTPFDVKKLLRVELVDAKAPPAPKPATPPPPAK
jgi:triosephosphate isomerase